MKAIINDNTMKACDLEVSAVNKIPELAVVKEVRISNVLDAEGKRTDKVDCIKYDCVNPDNFSTFTIKVNTTRPVITNEIIDGADEYSCAMKSHFRKSGNQMSGKWKSSYASLLA